MVTLVVEDGTGKQDANSYASEATASAHHAGLGRTEWAEASRLTGSLTLRAVPTDGDTITIGGTATYTFKTSPSAARHVNIGSTPLACASNLAAALNCDADPTGRFHASTAVSQFVTAAAAQGTGGWVATVTLTDKGDGSEPVPLAVTMASQSNALSGAALEAPDAPRAALVKATRYLDAKYGPRLTGERASEDQALEFPRSNAEYLDTGDALDEDQVPEDWVKACCETALHILQLGDLDAPVEPADSGRTTSESLSLGPISVSTSYAGAGLATSVSLPAVVGLVRRLVGSSSEVYRA